MSLRRKAVAAVEITALAPGAGPPAKRMATRLKLCCIRGGRAMVDSCMTGSFKTGAKQASGMISRRQPREHVVNSLEHAYATNHAAHGSRRRHATQCFNGQ